MLLIFIGGCSKVQESQLEPTPNASNNISGTLALILSEKEISQLGMTSEINEQDLVQLGLNNGTNCRTDEDYTNVVDSSRGAYTLCVYNIKSLNNTQLIIELTKFTNYEALNGSYGYSSSHLFGAKGLISENDFGDQSRFHVSDPSDYGGEFNKPNEYYYNLYFTKELYLIHITSGKDKEAKDYILKIGRKILSKFE